MSFDELLTALNDHKNIQVLDAEYNEAAFGNFVINALFCKKMWLQIINDRGIVYLEIVIHGWQRKRNLPIKIAVSCALSHGNLNCPYNFESIDTAYEFLISNLGTLEAINKKRLLGNIWREWRKNANGRKLWK
jgi:hypothetical protein